jgi:hypothetical protein
VIGYMARSGRGAVRVTDAVAEAPTASAAKSTCAMLGAPPPNVHATRAAAPVPLNPSFPNSVSTTTAPVRQGLPDTARHVGGVLCFIEIWGIQIGASGRL